MSFQNAKIICADANPEEYHSAAANLRGTIQFPMSAGSLANFSHCPNRFKNGYVSPESEAKDYGLLLDCRALTPGQFAMRYVIQPATYTNAKREIKPWNNNASACKKWIGEQDGLKIIRKSDVLEVDDAIRRLLSDPVIAGWFEACDKQVWVAGEWVDPETELCIPVRCLLDFVPRPDTEFAKCLGDLKTTRNGSLLPWQRFCYSMKYHWQAAWDLDLYVAATLQDRNTWCWILQENFVPWQTAKRIMSQDFLTLARAEYRQAMANYCQCLKHGRWPDYDEHDEAIQGWSIVQPEPFMAERAAFAPKFDFSDDGTEIEPSNDPDLIP